MTRWIALLLSFVVAGTASAYIRDTQQLDDGARPLVLAARAKLAHPAYRQTVVFVAPVGNDRHIGVIVNRQTRAKLTDLFPDDEPSRSVRDFVWYGGPMMTNMLVAITNGERSPGGKSLAIGDSLHLAFEGGVIDDVIRTRPDEARYFVGIVQWRPGELRHELREGFWQIADMKPERVLQVATDRVWKELDEQGRNTYATAWTGGPR